MHPPADPSLPHRALLTVPSHPRFHLCSDKTPAALFFRYNTQLGPPYQVIIDTNFINFSIRNKIDLVKVRQRHRIRPLHGGGIICTAAENGAFGCRNPHTLS